MFRWTRGGIEDRAHALSAPGAHEWWGFEAYDSTRELAVAVRIAVADPMDPEFARTLAKGGEDEPPAKSPVRVRCVVYRRNKRVLARTLRPDPGAFAASPSSGAVRAGPARVDIEESADRRTHRVRVEPGVDLRFSGPPGRPAATGPLDEPVWDLASLCLDVEGELLLGGETVTFSGRGVHEHAFAPHAARLPVRTWAWGWADAWEFGVAWRQMVLESGDVETLLVVDRKGEPFIGEEATSRPFRARYSLLGVPYRRQWRLDAPESSAGLAVENLGTLASSPLGMRFLCNIRLNLLDPEGRLRLVAGIGLSSVARPFRARVAPVRWMSRLRDLWNTTPVS